MTLPEKKIFFFMSIAGGAIGSAFFLSGLGAMASILLALGTVSIPPMLWLIKKYIPRIRAVQLINIIISQTIIQYLLEQNINCNEPAPAFSEFSVPEQAELSRRLEPYISMINNSFSGNWTAEKLYAAAEKNIPKCYAYWIKKYPNTTTAEHIEQFKTTLNESISLFNLFYSDIVRLPEIMATLPPSPTALSVVPLGDRMRAKKARQQQDGLTANSEPTANEPAAINATKKNNNTI